jgi:hypothetical protein
MRDLCVIPKAWFKCRASSTSQSRARICRSVSDRSAITNWTSRNTNAKNVSLPHCNADWMEGELTSSRTRATVAPSGRVWVGGRFCHSKFFAALMAHSITRSEFMREKRTCKAAVPLRAIRRSVRMLMRWSTSLSAEPLAYTGVRPAWRLSFISRRSSISGMGASSAISRTRSALLASRRLDREWTSAMKSCTG